MAKKFYLGINNKAYPVANAYIGVGGVAKRIKKIYVGDTSGKAKQVYSDEIDHVEMQLFGVAGKNYPNGDWVVGLEHLSDYGYFSISGNQLYQYCNSSKQVISYWRYVVVMKDGRNIDLMHFYRDTHYTVKVNLTGIWSYDGGGGNVEGYNMNYQAYNTTITFTCGSSDECNMYAFGKHKGTYLYVSRYQTGYTGATVNWVEINGTRYTPTTFRQSTNVIVS